MKIFTLIGALLLMGNTFVAQEDENWDFDNSSEEAHDLGPAFFDTRVINSHSVEVLEKGTWDVRIAHRFGDMATTNAYKTMFGLDNSSDIKIGVDWGVSDKFMLGFHRNKGAGPYGQLLEGIVKYKILDQGEKSPIDLTVVGSAFFTMMDKSSDSTSVTFFTKTAHRASYCTQLILARNLSDKASIQLNAAVVHRNLVAYDDENTTFAIGGVAKVKLLKKMSLIGEYTHMFRNNNTINGVDYVDASGLGIEFKTFAHVFQINFTNSRGMGEAQFIPYTSSKWSNGEVRLGFTISRHF